MRTLLLLLLICAACTGDDPLPDCSEATIDVRPFDGPPVERTWIDCAGELAGNCDPPFATYLDDGCGGARPSGEPSRSSLPSAVRGTFDSTEPPPI